MTFRAYTIKIQLESRPVLTAKYNNLLLQYNTSQRGTGQTLYI